MVNISFRVNDEGNILTVSYDDNMSVEAFIIDFLTKHSNFVSLDTKYYTFRTQGKILNSKRFLKTPLKEVLTTNGIVMLARKEKTHYS